jgi:hypothetical protein
VSTEKPAIERFPPVSYGCRVGVVLLLSHVSILPVTVAAVVPPLVVVKVPVVVSGFKSFFLYITVWAFAVEAIRRALSAKMPGTYVLDLSIEV